MNDEVASDVEVPFLMSKCITEVPGGGRSPVSNATLQVADAGSRCM